MGENTHNDYADRKNNRQAVSYDHEALETVLSGTYGLMVYQEDIMRVATTLAGYTLPRPTISVKRAPRRFAR